MTRRSTSDVFGDVGGDGDGGQIIPYRAAVLRAAETIVQAGDLSGDGNCQRAVRKRSNRLIQAQRAKAGRADGRTTSYEGWTSPCGLGLLRPRSPLRESLPTSANPPGSEPGIFEPRQRFVMPHLRNRRPRRLLQTSWKRRVDYFTSRRTDDASLASRSGGVHKLSKVGMVL